MPFLLERLAARPHAMDGRAEPFDETAAILAQIQRLVAGRTLHAGGASAVLRWGMPGIVEIGNADMVALARYADSLRQAILQHEPRLRDVAVTLEPQDDALCSVRLLVTAQRADDGEACRFEFPLPR